MLLFCSPISQILVRFLFQTISFQTPLDFLIFLCYLKNMVD
nr:MAG TPA: hypothetical protein [Caudoviricetes sp.]